MAGDIDSDGVDIDLLMPHASLPHAGHGTLVARAPDELSWYTIHDSPLWHTGHSLAGLIVTDPRGVAAIRARIAWYARPWWRRLRRPPWPSC